MIKLKLYRKHLHFEWKTTWITFGLAMLSSIISYWSYLIRN